MVAKKSTANKPAKRRPSKGKMPALGRTKIFVAIVLFTLLLIALVCIAITNKQTQIESKKQTLQKAERIVIKNNVEQTIKKENINVREAIKFDKDENLSKIFLDTKSGDETHALSQKLSDKKILEQNNKIRPKLESKELKISETNTSINSKPTELDVMFGKKVDFNHKTAIKNDEILSQSLTQEKSSEAKVQISKEKPQAKPEKHETPKFIETKSRNKYTNKNKPKLAIVIDDVATHTHANMIFSTGLKITPSIFPVSRNYPNTQEVAKKFSFFMIHLPMQAQNSSGQEAETLLVGESIKSITQKVHKIRNDFPKARFINNHMGSKFTSDFNAMNMTFEILQNEGFVFMDSKTINTTKVGIIAKKHNVPYFSRDVFLDDKDNYKTIKKQLELAIKIAKQNGLAIAIGHPRKNTIAVLKDATSLLNDVELIYINEAYDIVRSR